MGKCYVKDEKSDSNQLEEKLAGVMLQGILNALALKFRMNAIVNKDTVKTLSPHYRASLFKEHLWLSSDELGTVPTLKPLTSQCGPLTPK